MPYQDTENVIGSLLLHRVAGGISTITLNRPDKANALLPSQRDALIHLLHQASIDTGIRVVVLQSAGKVFCAGADINTIIDQPGDSGERQRRHGEGARRITFGAQRLVTAILDCEKPVIAALQGTAAGLGAQLAIACDLIVASEDGAIAESFVQRGILVDSGGAYLLPRRIGLQKAKELVFFGDKLGAHDALRIGLINQVVPAAQLQSAVDQLAARLAAAPTLAVGLAKKLLNQSLDSDRLAALTSEALALDIVSWTEDFREGTSAFLEKRTPRFRGY
jgi:2-(1,2-epoxy-1,2-dihydrophenyl)acetyl-CoA isomerase